MRVKKRKKVVYWKPFAKPLALVAAAALILFGSQAGTFAGPGEESMIRLMLGRDLGLPGKQTDGRIVLSDFESVDAMRPWNFYHSKVFLSTQFPSEGKQSGKVIFSPSEDLSSVILADLMKSKRAVHDWAGHEVVSFELFNPGPPRGVRFMVSDREGKKFDRDLKAAAGPNRFQFAISDIEKAIDTRHVNGVSIAVRRPEAEVVFFVDHLRVEPKVVTVQNAATPAMMQKIAQMNTAEFLKSADEEFAKKKSAWAVADRGLGTNFIRVPFIVKNEAPFPVFLAPVNGSFPFAKGELTDTGLVRIRDARNQLVPFQSKVLGTWPDGSIKWLNVSAELSMGPSDGFGYFLEYGPAAGAMPFQGSLRVDDKPESIEVAAGYMRVRLSKKSFMLVERAWIDRNRDNAEQLDERVVSNARLSLDFDGKTYSTDLDNETYEIKIEESGPMKAVIKASGWYQNEEGKRFCQAIVRYTFYQGKEYVKVNHTLIYTGYPANKHFHAYKDLDLPKNEMIQRYGLTLPFDSNEEATISFGQRAGNPSENFAPGVSFFQGSWTEAILNGKRVDGALGAGWVDLSDRYAGVSVFMPEMRENFPKGLKADATAKEIHFDFWPREAGPLDLQTSADAVGPDDVARGSAFGLAKTHEIFLYFHGKNSQLAGVPQLFNALRKPLTIRVNPYWIEATGVLGKLAPAEKRFEAEEKMLDAQFDWAARHPKNFAWYGMLNYGDTLTWFRQEEGGWNPKGRWGWYGCEGAGLHYGSLLQYLRTGNWKYFEFGRNAARHIMDVDTIHYDTVGRDPRLKGLISPEVSRVGSMHRHSADHWSGRSDEASHTNVAGILLYYYITGDERAMDVAKEIGEYFLSEPFTYMGHPDIAPLRALANVLWGDVLLFQATGNAKFLQAADKIVGILKKAQLEDGSFRANYDPLTEKWSGEKHGLFMAGYAVPALIAYHDITWDEDVKKMFLALVKYLESIGYGEQILHGYAYAYHLTRDADYIHLIDKELKKLAKSQAKSDDPMRDGLIGDKPIYHRPMTYLSTIPYVFAAMNDDYASRKGKLGGRT